MFRHWRFLAATALIASPTFAQSGPTVAQFLSPSSPLSLGSAKKTDRLAWPAYERGMRNVYTAAAPAFTPVRLTSWLKDDGSDVSDVTLSDDGSVIVFVRGSDPNRVGWIANPLHDPNGQERAIWAVRSLACPGNAFGHHASIQAFVQNWVEAAKSCGGSCRRRC